MKIAGVIIAGGRSSRMGQEKALVLLGGRTLLSHVIGRVAPQVERLAINANGDANRFDPFGLAVIPDRRSDIGTPLAGLHAGLIWAEETGFDAVLTVPSDAPFLPRDLAARLAGEDAAVAASRGQTHYLTGVWPTKLLPLLQEFFVQDRYPRESGNPALGTEGSGAPAFAGVAKRSGMIRVQDWVVACNARIAEWPDLPYDPFFNINTPDDLATAERIAAEFKP